MQDGQRPAQQPGSAPRPPAANPQVPSNPFASMFFPMPSTASPATTTPQQRANPYPTLNPPAANPHMPTPMMGPFAGPTPTPMASNPYLPFQTQGPASRMPAGYGQAPPVPFNFRPGAPPPARVPYNPLGYTGGGFAGQHTGFGFPPGGQSRTSTGFPGSTPYGGPSPFQPPSPFAQGPSPRPTQPAPGTAAYTPGVPPMYLQPSHHQPQPSTQAPQQQAGAPAVQGFNPNAYPFNARALGPSVPVQPTARTHAGVAQDTAEAEPSRSSVSALPASSFTAGLPANLESLINNPPASRSGGPGAAAVGSGADAVKEPTTPLESVSMASSRAPSPGPPTPQQEEVLAAQVGLNRGFD